MSKCWCWYHLWYSIVAHIEVIFGGRWLQAIHVERMAPPMICLLVYKYYYPWRIRMYGRLMLTKLGFLLMVNGKPLIWHTYGSYGDFGYYSLAIIFFETWTWQTYWRLVFSTIKVRLCKSHQIVYSIQQMGTPSTYWFPPHDVLHRASSITFHNISGLKSTPFYLCNPHKSLFNQLQTPGWCT